MNYLSVKIIFCVAVALAMLMAPFALDIAPGGKAFALGSHGGGGSGNPSLRSASTQKTKWTGYTFQESGENGDGNCTRTTHKVPEPTTMILVGCGLAGLAVFRRKFKN